MLYGDTTLALAALLRQILHLNPADVLGLILLDFWVFNVEGELVLESILEVL